MRQGRSSTLPKTWDRPHRDGQQGMRGNKKGPGGQRLGLGGSPRTLSRAHRSPLKGDAGEEFTRPNGRLRRPPRQGSPPVFRAPDPGPSTLAEQRCNPSRLLALHRSTARSTPPEAQRKLDVLLKECQPAHLLGEGGSPNTEPPDGAPRAHRTPPPCYSDTASRSLGRPVDVS
jgi:hypothetical protein